jgi:hypothetical protein
MVLLHPLHTFRPFIYLFLNNFQRIRPIPEGEEFFSPPLNPQAEVSSVFPMLHKKK